MADIIDSAGTVADVVTYLRDAYRIVRGLLSSKSRSKKKRTPMPIALTNTLSGAKETFTPSFKPIRMYNCGPTVYGVQHIGNLSMFVFTNLLRRMLEANGLSVMQVINITDFGHLTGDNEGDADLGEDRMTRALKAEGKELTMANMKVLAEKYTDIWQSDLRALSIDTSEITFPRASDYIPAQIALIKTLQEKGYAYKTSHGVYFDTVQFKDYGALGGINLEGLKEGARVAVVSEKRNPTDFILWKSSENRERHQNSSDARLGGSDDRGVLQNTMRATQGPQNAAADSSGVALGWESPWGLGFPGWHIECSAMARSCLGEQIDIHTGGIEHIPIHHNNEIAQSEAATGKKPFSRFWLHRGHLQIDDHKIAKSLGNTIYLTDIIKKGFHPLAFRYWLLTSHYRSSANFTWEALQSAQTAFLKLHRIARDSKKLSRGGSSMPTAYTERILRHVSDDLDTAGALAVVWEMMKDEKLGPDEIYAGLMTADTLFGIGLSEPDELMGILLKNVFGEDMSRDSLPPEIQMLVDDREAARTAKDWARSDELREKLKESGYDVSDGPDGPAISKR